jgi:hypothetical protein
MIYDNGNNDDGNADIPSVNVLADVCRGTQQEAGIRLP